MQYKRDPKKAFPCTETCHMTCKLSKSVKLLLRYSNLSFFQDRAVRHLGFVECILVRPTKSIRMSLSLYKIWLESLQWL